MVKISRLESARERGRKDVEGGDLSISNRQMAGFDWPSTDEEGLRRTIP
jgi:hypothetical protein